MKHLAVTESDIDTLIFALRCGERELLDHTNAAIENPTSSTIEQVREYSKMRLTLIRLENQINPD